MKKFLLFLFAFSSLLSIGQTYNEAFDVDANWSGGSGYIPRTYILPSPLYADKFSSNDVFREGTDVNSGSYAWRLDDQAGAYFRYECEGTVTGFSVYSARWDNSPKPFVTARYSINSGTTWSTAFMFDGDDFSGDLVYKQFSHTFTSSITNTSGNKIFIEFLTTAGERIFYDDFSVTFGTSGPTITSSPVSLSDLDYIVGNGPSIEQNFTVSGSSLTNDIVITNNTTNYEMSTATGVAFVATSPITLTQSGGGVSNTDIYVRLKSGLSIGTYDNEVIDVTSIGATAKTAICNGEVTPVPPALPNAWINEFHYDNDGTDVNEFVEIVIEGISPTPADFTVTLYNGNGGTSYDTKTLDNYTVGTPLTQEGRTWNFYYYVYSSIQNGAPDGLALSWDDGAKAINLIEFLSYEGSFTASGGPADGVTSTNVGVSETGSALIGTSISRIDTGSTTPFFTWQTGVIETPGAQNTDQYLPIELLSFEASSERDAIKISWATISEINSQRFEILRSTNGLDFEKIYSRNGQGNSNVLVEYYWYDNSFELNQTYYYQLNMVDNDGSSELSGIVVVRPHGNDIELYPNPTNGILHIEGAQVDDQVEVYNIAGKNVYSTIISESNTINLDYLPKGIYFATITTQDQVISRKIIIE